MIVDHSRQRHSGGVDIPNIRVNSAPAREPKCASKHSALPVSCSRSSTDKCSTHPNTSGKERAERSEAQSVHEDQITAISEEAEVDPVKTVCARHKISRPIYYKRMSKFGGMEVERSAALRRAGRREQPPKAGGADHGTDPDHLLPHKA